LVDVVIKLFKTNCILLCGLDACPVSPRQLRSFNHVVVSCGRKMFNVNTSEIAAECLKCFEFATSPRLWPHAKTDSLRDTC